VVGALPKAQLEARLAECFNRLIGDSETLEGLRQFNERDHPDRQAEGSTATPGLARPGAGE
jgi:enoyl-CoA hydratase